MAENCEGSLWFRTPKSMVIGQLYWINDIMMRKFKNHYELQFKDLTIGVKLYWFDSRLNERHRISSMGASMTWPISRAKVNSIWSSYHNSVWNDRRRFMMKVETILLPWCFWRWFLYVENHRKRYNKTGKMTSAKIWVLFWHSLYRYWKCSTIFIKEMMILSAICRLLIFNSWKRF